MFSPRAFFTTALIAATRLPTVWGKAEAVFYADSDCSGVTRSLTVGFSTGVCHLSELGIPFEGAGDAQSVHFYTNGDVEYYGFYHNPDCTDLAFTKFVASDCVSYGTFIQSVKKLA
ncbi:hypothetical protein B0H19DRAFT_1069967 [Mycena capillaripes]|nr:hypothetical protein B0H19DRAFT_1069967 [Mycena capillaripes]